MAGSKEAKVLYWLRTYHPDLARRSWQEEASPTHVLILGLSLTTCKHNISFTDTIVRPKPPSCSIMFARKDLERDVLSAYQRHSRNLKKASAGSTEPQQPRTVSIEAVDTPSSAQSKVRTSEPPLLSPIGKHSTYYMLEPHKRRQQLLHVFQG